MGLTKKSDGRYVVGKGIEDGNEYKGSAAWRDMVIQYSGDGATDKSLEYLTFLKDYALYHSAQGNPVIPPNVQIWMSTANTMKAVEADDITVDGETVKIGSCTWDGSAWSFSEPTPGGGGSSLPRVTDADNGDVLAVVNGEWSKAPAPSSLPAYTSADIGKVLTVSEDVEHPIVEIVVPEQSVTIESGGTPYTILQNADVAAFVDGRSATITVDDFTDTVTISSGRCNVANGTTVYVIASRGEDLVFACMDSSHEPPQAISGEYSVSLSSYSPVVINNWVAIPPVYYIVKPDANSGALDKTYDEISEAFDEGLIPIIKGSYLGNRVMSPILLIGLYNSSNYNVYAILGANAHTSPQVRKWTSATSDGTLSLVAL